MAHPQPHPQARPQQQQGEAHPSGAVVSAAGHLNAHGTHNFAAECLNRHNHYRMIHGVAPLMADAHLNQLAQQWCNHLAQVNQVAHSAQSETLGENIFHSAHPDVTPWHAVDSWYSEINKFNFHNITYHKGTGHFTQMVWKSTLKLGVGYVSNKNGTWVVCNYDPPGNITGHPDPYPNNVFPARPH